MKEYLKLFGLGSLLSIGSILGLFLIVLAIILVTAGPVVLVIWVIAKLFFH